MDSSHSLIPSSRGGIAVGRPRGLAEPLAVETVLQRAIAGRTESDRCLASKRACSRASRCAIAQVYSQEHNRDLRQSILELNLIHPRC